MHCKRKEPVVFPTREGRKLCGGRDIYEVVEKSLIDHSFPNSHYYVE